MNGKTKSKIITTMIYVFLIVVAVVYIAPLLWVFMVSFKTNAEIFSDPFALPESLYLDNYTFAWTAGKLGIATLNSFIVCGVTH